MMRSADLEPCGRRGPEPARAGVLSLSKGTNLRFDELSAHATPGPALCALSLSKGTNLRFDELSAQLGIAPLGAQ